MAVNVGRVQLLVDALRSGEFEQCKGQLRHGEGDAAKYCCLGVASEVHKAATGKDYDGEGAFLSEEIRDWYGFREKNPAIGTVPQLGEGQALRATTWNDSCDKSFAEIADAFERTYIKQETPATAGVTTEGS